MHTSRLLFLLPTGLCARLVKASTISRGRGNTDNRGGDNPASAIIDSASAIVDCVFGSIFNGDCASAPAAPTPTHTAAPISSPSPSAVTDTASASSQVLSQNSEDAANTQSAIFPTSSPGIPPPASSTTQGTSLGNLSTAQPGPSTAR
ncbi:hypothetical protein B0H12DRAFT_1237066 [Mycena haematopus]|nr:hypothetical protein B0H12DRAFT_1237066 [Mycena haematopus]